jgi:DNA-binding GntR family transcriptional regulator
MFMELAGHPTVWDLIASAKTQLDRVRHLSLESADWLDVVFAQHRQIVERVAAKDGARAEKAMREHLRSAFAAIGASRRIDRDFFEGFHHRRKSRTKETSWIHKVERNDPC